MIKPLPGVYALVIPVARDIGCRVGRLGDLKFGAGWYVYLGSAHGGGGIRARVGRHASANKRHHWHVDYLLDHASIHEVWFSHTSRTREHDWVNYLLAVPGASVPFLGFGSSDCRFGCRSHLVRFDYRPTPALLRAGHLAGSAKEPIHVEHLGSTKHPKRPRQKIERCDLLDAYHEGRVWLDLRRRASYDGLEVEPAYRPLTKAMSDEVSRRITETVMRSTRRTKKDVEAGAKYAEAIETIIGNCGIDGFDAMFLQPSKHTAAAIKVLSPEAFTEHFASIAQSCVIPELGQ